MSGPLSIAMLSHLASPRAPTGAERSLLLLANALAARRHRIAVALPSPWTLEGALASEIEIRRIPCRMCWLTHHEGEPAWRVVARALRFATPDLGGARIERWLRADRPDVVHVNCLPHVRGARAARRAGRPVVWHIREILPPGPRRRWFAVQIAWSAASVVAVSEAVASWLREEGLGSRVVVVPNGYDPPEAPRDGRAARRDLGLPEDGTIVGLFGQIRPHKGVLEAIEAAAIASRAVPDLRLVVAGEGPPDFLAAVDAAATAHGLGERFHRLSGRSDPADLFAAADVVALATRTPDPLPRSVLEGMAWGRPVAAFRSGGVAEMVVDGETGLLVEGGEVAGLAAAFARLAGDSGLRRRLGEEGRRLARERFSVEGHVKRMESIFRGLAGR